MSLLRSSLFSSSPFCRAAAEVLPSSTVRQGLTNFPPLASMTAGEVLPSPTAMEHRKAHSRQGVFSLLGPCSLALLVLLSGLLPSRPATAGSWNVRIRSSPSGARVQINGTYQGKTPLRLQLKRGRYHLELRRARHLTWTSYLEVAPRVRLTVHAMMERIRQGDPPSRGVPLDGERGTPPGRRTPQGQTGLLIVFAKPHGASVYWEGRLLGVTPLLTQMPLGSHQLTIRKKGYLPQQKKAKIRVEKAFRLKVLLQRNPAAPKRPSAPPPAKNAVQLLLRSEPPGRIYLNGRFLGMTPFISDGLRPGTYRLQVRRRGYFSHRRTLHLKGGRRYKLKIHLVPRRSTRRRPARRRPGHRKPSR